MTTKVLGNSSLTLMAVAFVLAQPGIASQIEEVVVTAQKRAENVQDVPIAISAFQGDSLKERGVTDI